MRKITTGFGIASLGLALALGTACSRQEAEEKASEAAQQMGEAAESAGEGAAAVARKAEQAAEEAARKAGEKAEEARDQIGTMVDPVARCRELASQGAWAEALEPCTKAHGLHPDDMELEHNLQQAQAAAQK